MQLSFKTVGSDDYRTLGHNIEERAAQQTSQENACQIITEMLYHAFEPEIALARVFRLTPAEWLPNTLTAQLRRHDDTALTLMGSYGIEESWRSRHTSVNHKIMSLSRITADREIPMMEEMLKQLGIDLDILYNTGDLLEANVNPGGIATPVYIPDVVGSPFIPDQRQFVEAYDIKSLIGFGGLFRDFDGDLSLYYTVVFTRVPITQEELERFTGLQAWVGTGIAPREGMKFFND